VENAQTREPFADSFCQAHEALRQNLGEVDEAARVPSRNPWELGSLLDKVRMHLLKHFRLEEKDGYMSEVLKEDPSRERTARHLLEEHCQLAECLDALVEEAAAWESRRDAFLEKVRAWVKRVQQHESRENRLIEDVLNRDLGTKD
jgi:hemerythrin-like domain-containing protein